MRGILGARNVPCEFIPDDFMRPADAFAHPRDVLRDADLTMNEKRAILAAWASDACALEAMPGLRKSPAGATVTFDEIMDALKDLDARLPVTKPGPSKRSGFGRRGTRLSRRTWR
jgi:hypothetical protein